MPRNVLRKASGMGAGRRREQTADRIRCSGRHGKACAARTVGDEAGGKGSPFFAKALALAEVGFQTTQGLGQIVDGVGVGKAQEAFGLAAEVDAGGDADMGFFQ